MPFRCPTKTGNSCDFFIINIIIRECGSTLYVGLARAVPPTVPPTNTNFWLTFLLTQIEKSLYEELPVQIIKFEVYHNFSGLNFIAEVNFWRLPKTVDSCDLITLIIIIIIIFHLKSIRVWKIAITLELLGQFLRLLDQNDSHSLGVLLIC